MKMPRCMPSHVCRQCGEWWIVEPVAQDRWITMRYGNHTQTWREAAIMPFCPDCKCVFLNDWMIDER